MNDRRPIHPPATASARGVRRGFSLVELLVAILILGVGVVSIAAILPAGISQQQKATDDAVGVVVARNAMGLLRSRLSAEQFGVGYQTFPIPAGATPFQGVGVNNLWPEYQTGDWGWVRPAFVPATPGGTFERGAIDVFNWLDSQGVTTFPDTFGAVPFNADYPFVSPWTGVIPQEDRVYPQGAESPEYVWECMFRRQNGRIEVAVFVFRVLEESQSTAPYSVAINGAQPPIPHFIDLRDGGPEPWRGQAWDAYDINGVPTRIIPGTGPGTPISLANPDHHWQLSGNLVVDQNGNLHRIALGREVASDLEVELAEVLVEVPISSAGGVGTTTADNVVLNPGTGTYVAGTNGWFDTDIVTQLWYVPSIDAAGRTLVPVFVLVEEL
ncbi:MAG: prepilin-type N-terminal cleavage/methylation domain-containing protein [Phycisphaerales bacterium]